MCVCVCVCVCVCRRRSPPGILQHSQAFPGLGVLFNLGTCIFISQKPVVPLTSTFTGSLPAPTATPDSPPVGLTLTLRPLLLQEWLVRGSF